MLFQFYSWREKNNPSSRRKVERGGDPDTSQERCYLWGRTRHWPNSFKCVSPGEEWLNFQDVPEFEESESNGEKIHFKMNCFNNAVVLIIPEGRLISSSCLESQGCHLIPLPVSSLVFFCPVLLLFLSCHLFAKGPFSWLFSRKLKYFSLRVRLFLYGSCWAARRW